MPVSFTMSVAPLALFSMIPPVGPGRSLTTREFCPRVCRTILGEVGRPVMAKGGTGADCPQRHPTQLTRLGTPYSTSTHNPAPFGGTKYDPIPGPGGPSRRIQGSAPVGGR